MAVASGACLAVPLATWRRLGGFAERFFMYHEDVDLSLRLRLAGGTVGIEPAAVVDHDYEFGASGRAQVALARAQPPGDRSALYPAPLLALLAPALLATELALLAAAAAGGWGCPEAARRRGSAAPGCRALLRERRADPGDAPGERRASSPPG